MFQMIGRIFCTAGVFGCWALIIVGAIGSIFGWWHDEPFHHPGLTMAEAGALMQFPFLATGRLFF